MSKIQTAVKQLKNNRGEFMASIIQNFFTWLPDATYLRLLYRFKMGHRLNLDNPQTFTEKLQWLKLYNRKPEYTTMVDKFAVKQYVANIIGEEYIIPTLGVWDKFDDIDFSSLPDQFVLKTTHGGGGCGVVICRDRQTFDKAAAKQTLESSMKSDIYKSLREWPYKNVKKRIIAEKYIEDESGYLRDYKVMCFNGQPKLIQMHMGRFNGVHTQDFYNCNWDKLDDINQNGCIKSDIVLPKPQCLEQMLDLSAKLSNGLPHIRVDWYIIGANFYFGEITFFDAGGFDDFIPESLNEVIGSWIELPIQNCLY